MDKTIRFSTGGGDFGKVTTRTTTWDKFSDRISTHEVAKKKGRRFFVGAVFRDGVRKDSHFVERTMLTLDIDHAPLTKEEIETELAFLGIRCVCYTTWSYCDDGFISLRVIAPLSRGVSGKDYRTLSTNIADRLDIPIDPCSFKPNQVMFRASCDADRIQHAWSFAIAGDPVDVDYWLESAAKDDCVDCVDGEEQSSALSLAKAIESMPLDLSNDEIRSYLALYPAQDCDYEAWLNVGMSLQHQFAGSNEGLAEWKNWSKGSDKYDEESGRYEARWASFSTVGNSGGVRTFRSIIKAVNNKAVADSGSIVEKLLAKAKTIDDLDSYTEFTAEVALLPVKLLRDDYRGMISKALHSSFGKDNGMSKPSINRALAYSGKKGKRVDRRNAIVDAMADDAPAWLHEWVYIETQCVYRNTELHYSIRPEAFNVKYNREPAVQSLDDMCATRFANDVCRIPCIVDMMYFPGAGSIFEYKGKNMLNLYEDEKIAPMDRGALADDVGAQEAIERFERHIQMLVSDPVEHTLLLDWLCHIVQRPFQRVNWLLVLQGGEGIGKTYVNQLLGAILGNRAVQKLDASAIHGRFTGWAHGALVNCIEEIRISGTNRYEVLDHLKPFLTNNEIGIEEKGIGHRTVPNFTTYMATTNHKDALPISDGDRRYAPIFCDIQSRGELARAVEIATGGSETVQEYFTALFSDLVQYPDALCRYLSDRVITSAFSAVGGAPITRSRAELITMSTSDIDDEWADAMANYECEVINKRLVDITWLKKLRAADGYSDGQARGLSSFLKRNGYVKMTPSQVRIAGKLHRIWIADTLTTGESRQIPSVVRDYHTTSEE